MYEYELIIIADVSLPEEKRQTLLKKIEDLIKKEGGKVAKVNEWGKRSLAYPIKKQTKGYYYLLELEFDLPTNGNLANKVKLEEKIIRSLLVKKPPVKSLGTITSGMNKETVPQ